MPLHYRGRRRSSSSIRLDGANHGDGTLAVEVDELHGRCGEFGGLRRKAGDIVRIDNGKIVLNEMLQAFRNRFFGALNLVKDFAGGP